MLKERAKILRRLMIIADMAIVALSFFICYYLKIVFRDFQPLEVYLWFLLILLFIWSFLLHRAGVYKSFRTRHLSEIFFGIFKSAFFGLLILSGAVYFLKIPDINRNFIAALFITATVFLCLEKIILLLIFRFLRKKGLNFRNVLIIGSNKRAESFIDIVKHHSEWGYRIVGIIDQDSGKIGQEINKVKIIGSFENVTDILHSNVIDEAVFIVPRSWLEKIKDLIGVFELEGIPVSIAADLFDLKFAKARQSELQGFPLLTFISTTDKYWQLVIKRILDVVISLIAFVAVFPFMIIIAFIIKLTSPGPVFFRQLRIGLNGRKFMFYKFRTMVVGAEEQLKNLANHNEMEGPAFKMKNDPRITPFGKFLRKTSLDELPQLWNVLIGDMSLVGPRPPIANEVERYDNWHRRRLSMRPGITCLWQVKGRSKINRFDDWIKLDLEYIDNWSLELDFKIILMTMPAVIFGVGAK